VRVEFSLAAAKQGVHHVMHIINKRRCQTNEGLLNLTRDTGQWQCWQWKWLN